MEEDFLSVVLDLYRDGKWREILDLRQEFNQDAALKLLWVWPSIENLRFIKETCNEFGRSGVVSLGCGCGLFEWILQRYSGMPVIGYEVNREWWASKYSNPLFIPHVYPEDSLTDSNYALLFCYFNDGAAFIDYVNNYSGNLIFIIGPGDGRGTHTEPEPFSPCFGQSKWRLHGYQEVKFSRDFIAAYARDKD